MMVFANVCKPQTAQHQNAANAYYVQQGKWLVQMATVTTLPNQHLNVPMIASVMLPVMQD
jgi:hypothetical protein